MPSFNAHTHAAVMAGGVGRCGGGDDGGEGGGIDGGDGDDARYGGEEDGGGDGRGSGGGEGDGRGGGMDGGEGGSSVRQCSAARACNADGLGIRHTADATALTSVAGAGCRRS